MSDASDSFIRVLGPLEVVSAAGLAHLGGPKQRAVLGMLTVQAGRVVTTDQLVDGIWGDAPPTAVSSSIHSYISTLRTVIDWPIARHGSGYMLDVDRARIDANVFEEAFERGRRELVASPSASADELREGLALWRGRAYADVADFPGLEDEARRLTDLRLSAVEVRIDADLALGRHTAVVGELEALAAENPFRESLRAKHMLALYRDGRQADALRAYRRTQDYLREELGVEPSPELAELEERILNHDYTLIHSNEVVNEKVALLFTDIVDSTLLWEAHPEAMQAALVRHSHIVQAAIEDAGGTVIRGLGDGFIAFFSEPSQAARAAIDAQKAIIASDWSPLEFRVRMAIDTGEVEKRGGELFGPPMTRGSRLLEAAHGGQIVLSNDAQRAITRDAGSQVKSLGENRIRGLGTPQAVHQLVADGLPSNFPPLNIAAGSIDLERSFGGSIRGYELRERIGQGAFATVYRGYQPSIGREVAIKIVKPEFANHPAFIRRFESEARFVAGLEHPHIVSVYDYWRDADGAYIVGPYLAGGSLANGTLANKSSAQAIKIASQVGSALSYAHRQGVLHRDVKPANILLDTDGNAYLSDFGIAARAVEAATGIQSKSVGYRAPEDRNGGAVDVRSDLYGLAAVMAHLLVGGPPERLDLGALDEPLHDVLARGLAVDPEDRYDSVDFFLADLLAPVGETESGRTKTISRNPYKGLAAFTEQDAPDFFGRSDEIERLVDLVSENRISAVIGPSGSGKSSLTLAGLLPTLAAGAVPRSETWISVRAVPGGYPFDELAVALGALSTEPLSVLATELASPDGRGVLRVAKRISQELEGDLFIVIDQFEELFTLVAEDDVRKTFAAALITAAGDPSSRVRILLTLRADFFHQVMTQPLLAPIIGRAHLALTNLDADGIRQAIVEPATRAGLRFEPGLPERIVADVKDQPGSMPLLQFTLDRLAASASDGLITDDDYVELGGVKGALAERAEATFQGLTASQKQAAQQVFTRLLSVSGEADDVRRRVRMTEFESLGLGPGDLEAVIEGFGRERLLTFDVDSTTRGATVEVAHEAILREWPTLRAWVDSRRESLLLQRRFQVALAEWEESDQNPTNLLTGGRLSQYVEWAAGEDVNLAAAEERFLEASIDHAITEAANRRARRRRITGGFAAAAVVALLLATAAFIQRSQAIENAALAEARRVVLEAERSLSTNPELSTLLALESIEAFRAAGLDPPGSAVAVLREGLRTSAVIKRIPGGRFVAVNAAGTLLATLGDDDVVVRSIAADDIPGTLTRPGASPIGAVFASGDTLAVSYSEVAHPVRVWKDWHQPDSFVDIGPGDTSTRDVESVQWSPDGDLVAIDGREVWSMTRAEKRYAISSNDQSSVAAFSADGRLGVLDSSDEGRSILRVLDAESGAELELINLDVPFQPTWLSYSPEGDRLAVADPFHLAVVDSQTGALAWRNDDLSRVGFPLWVNGEQLLVGGEGIPAVVDAASGNMINKLPGHRGGTESSAQIPGRMQVASAGSEDRETIIFDLGNTPFEVGGFTSSISEIDYMWSTEDGANLLVQDGGNSQAGVIIDAVTGDIEGHFPGTEIVHSSHGRFSAGIDAEGRAVLWSTAEGREVFVAPDGWEVRGASDDGSLAVIAGPTTRVVRTADGSLVTELDAGSGVHEAIFSPDLRSVVTNNNGVRYPGIRVFDVSSGDLLGSIGTLGGLASMFTPDGSKLVIGGYDGHVNIFDFAKLRAAVDERQALVHSIAAHEAFILSATVSPDGTMLFSRAWDEPVRLWGLETGESLGEFGSLDPANEYPPAAAFHPTEPWLYASVGDSQIAIYTLDTHELVEIARSRLTRSLTAEECQLYLQESCVDDG